MFGTFYEPYHHNMVILLTNIPVPQLHKVFLSLKWSKNSLRKAKRLRLMQLPSKFLSKLVLLQSWQKSNRDK